MDGFLAWLPDEVVTNLDSWLGFPTKLCEFGILAWFPDEVVQIWAPDWFPDEVVTDLGPMGPGAEIFPW